VNFDHVDVILHENINALLGPANNIRVRLGWAVCCLILDHVVILLRILAFKFSNRRVHMKKQCLAGLKNNSLENLTWCREMGKQTARAKKV